MVLPHGRLSCLVPHLTVTHHLVRNAIIPRELRPPPLSDDLHAQSLSIPRGCLPDVPVADNPQCLVLDLTNKEDGWADTGGTLSSDEREDLSVTMWRRTAVLESVPASTGVPREQTLGALLAVYRHDSLRGIVSFERQHIRGESRAFTQGRRREGGEFGPTSRSPRS